MAPRGPTSIHQLKITLMGVRPPIWRRLQVSSSINLRRLHDVIQAAMGWTQSHLYRLMPPDPITTAAGGFGQRLRTMPAVLRHHRHGLVHLLHRQQRAVGPAVSRLAAPLPARRRRFRPRWGLGRIRRWGTRGIGGVLPEPGF